MVFALSAVHPRNHLISLLNIYEQLSEGSYVLFRDYGIHDMTMYRHNIRHDENLYERSDGTLSYYFDIDYFTSLAMEANFDVIEIKYATVINRNRKTRVEMKRVFLHAVLQKRIITTTTNKEENSPLTSLKVDFIETINSSDSGNNNNSCSINNNNNNDNKNNTNDDGDSESQNNESK